MCIIWVLYLEAHFYIPNYWDFICIWSTLYCSYSTWDFHVSVPFPLSESSFCLKSFKRWKAKHGTSLLAREWLWKDPFITVKGSFHLPQFHYLPSYVQGILLDLLLFIKQYDADLSSSIQFLTWVSHVDLPSHIQSDWLLPFLFFLLF